jgi:hypothetical protein
MKKMLLVLGWLVFGHALAEEPCLTIYQDEIKDSVDLEALQVYGILNGERESGCLLGATDTTGIESQYQKLLAKPSGADLGIERGLLLEMMIAQFDGVPARVCEGLLPECVAGRQLDALKKLEERVKSGDLDLANESRDQWAADNFSSYIAISDINVADFIESQCEGNISQQVCADAFALSARIMRTSLAANELITSYLQPVIDVNERFLSLRDKEWEAYLNGDSVQFPWELAFNSWRFDKTTENKELFPQAPSYQWVLFHPSPAFEVIDTPDNSRSMEAAIVVEVVGYQGWRWRDGKQHNRWGASAIISVADIKGMDTLGYGALIHTPIAYTSIGVTWRDGDDGTEVGVVLNLNVAKLLEKYDNNDLKDFLN